MKKINLCLLIIVITIGIFASDSIDKSNDPTLLLHYLFNVDPGDKALDLSGYNNHGKIENAQYLPEVDGHKGVLRFDGKSSSLDIGNPKSLQISGDLTVEMFIRRNRELTAGPNSWQAVIFGQYPSVGNFMFGWVFYHTLQVRYGNSPEFSASIVSINRDVINSQWSHIAVVFEYPRCRIYRNGILVHDGNMLVPGVNSLRGKFIGGMPSAVVDTKSPAGGNWAPVDIAEFKLYKRALDAKEIVAHATNSQTFTNQISSSITTMPDWYKNKLIVRYTLKNQAVSNKQVTFNLESNGKSLVSQKATLKNVSGNSSLRMEAITEFPLDELNGKIASVSAMFNRTVATTSIELKKPNWIQCDVGNVSEVPPPWTPIQLNSSDDQLVVAVYGRTYKFGKTIFPEQIISKDEKILSSPIILIGKDNNSALKWQLSKLKYMLNDKKTALTLSQNFDSEKVTFKVASVLEYDGYQFFDCELVAKSSLTINSLMLSLPMLHQDYCAGSFVYKQSLKNSMSESYWDSIKGDLNFLFAPSIWIGNDEIGLTWQSESDVFWRNADKQKAIQIKQTDKTTTFLANFIDIPVKLAKGDTLKYKFALLATPTKPMLNDAWSLRVMRCLYGAEFRMPDNKVNGVPELEYLKKIGVRNLYISTGDCWPWPVPVHQEYSDAVKKLNQSAHDVGLKTHTYLLHIRFPVMVDAFSDYGRQIAGYPVRPYMHKGDLPPVNNNPRPGPISMEWGAAEQGTVIYCPKSPAAQDAYIHNLDQRIRQYKDDGVYLDGTGQVMPCSNLEHGCGYIDQNGKIQPTYPVFACRDFSRRIYNVVKRNSPEGMVDLHYWHPNPGQASYADLLFTGEQWHQLKKTGAEYVAGELTPARFRTMFMGYQVGTPMELMSYRLGSTRRVAAISLLHDVPVRLNQGGKHLPVIDTKDKMAKDFSKVESEDRDYFEMLPKLWKIRDDFDMKNAKKLFYWKNRDYVTVGPKDCYATLFVHPEKGVLAIVSNLSMEKQEVTVSLNLDKLKLSGQKLKAINPLNGESIQINNGKFVLPLISEDYSYIWIK